MSEIFAQAPDMTPALEKAIKAEQKTRTRDNRERSEMLIERDEIRDEYQDLLGLGKHGRELARQKIQQCERRLEELESRIASADRHTGAALKPADQARAIVAELAGVVRRLDKMPNAEERIKVQYRVQGAHHPSLTLQRGSGVFASETRVRPTTHKGLRHLPRCSVKSIRVTGRYKVKR